MEKTIIPENIVNDIANTGYSIENIHVHGKFFIIKLEKVKDMNWSTKDFSRFKWVVSGQSFNEKTFKLKITF